jgi:surface carbohydrate biosynthesis protein
VIRPRVCLIVDNPLRDLDGLTLVAWHLAQQNCEVWLVPMYEQAFDVRAVDADFVLANYARFNNRTHLFSYLDDGIRVGVLDTEGVGGKNANEFATLVGSDIGAGLVDLYCVWGPSQGDALVARKVVGLGALRVTGCPRYDFCAPPWRGALPKPAVGEGFVLVNTNFPTVNPRFSAGSGDEVRTMVNAGFEPAFAEAYVRDARVAQAGIIALLGDLVDQFPSVDFILRPHPFESAAPYQALVHKVNFEVRQEGTSIEWLNACKVLLHLNCSTAVEAAMLGKPAISPGWLDTPALHIEGPHSVSLHASSPADLFAQLATCIDMTPPLVHESIEARYCRIDGKSSQRVADAILETLGKPPRVVALPDLPFRFRVVMAMRRLLGYRAAKVIQELGAPKRERARRQAKLFTRDQVDLILHRLKACAPGAGQVIAESMSEVRVAVPRWASGTSIRITAITTQT